MIFILSSCNKSPTETFFDCINDECEVEESSEVLINYLETLDDVIDLNIENFEIEGYIISHSDKDNVVVSLAYMSDDLNYTEGFNYLDTIYSIFLIMKENIIPLDTDKIIQISVAILIEDGNNSHRYIFQTNIDDGSTHLGIELDGFVDEYEVFIENVTDELAQVFSYSDESDINILLITDIGYIHIDSNQNSNSILLDVNSSNTSEAFQIYLLELKGSIEEALDYEFVVTLDEY